MDWQVDFVPRLSLSRKQNQTQQSVLCFYSSPLKSWAFMFCILFAGVNMQMNITERWSSFMNRKAGKWRDLYLCWCGCVRPSPVGPQRERHNLHKWRPTSHWREKEKATCLSTECLWANHYRKIHVLCEWIWITLQERGGTELLSNPFNFPPDQQHGPLLPT